MWDSLLAIFKMEQVMIPGEYFLSVKYNQVYVGEMHMHFFMKYKNTNGKLTVPAHHFLLQLNLTCKWQKY